MNRITRILLFAFLLITFFSCNDSDDVQPTALFTLNVDAAYPTGNTDNWVFINDKDGKLIDAKKFEHGDVVTLETTGTIPEEVSVSLFSFDSSRTDSYSRWIRTYTTIPAGQEWILKRNTSISTGGPVNGGEISVLISGGVDVKDSYSLSSKWGSSYYGGSMSAGSLMVTTDLLDPGSTYIATVAPFGGNPVYKTILNTQAQTYNFSMNDFQEFDDYLSVSYPSSSSAWAFVYALDPSQTPALYRGFEILHNSPRGVSSSSATIGFLDQFTTYTVLLDLGYDGYSYEYFWLGPKPTSISIPEQLTFGLKNNTVAGFSLLKEQSFDMRSSRFKYTNNSGTLPSTFYWDIFAPTAGGTPLEFPDALTSRYQLSDVSNLTHDYTTFTAHGRTYSDFIGETYRSKQPANTLNQLNVIVNN